MGITIDGLFPSGDGGSLCASGLAMPGGGGWWRCSNTIMVVHGLILVGEIGADGCGCRWFVCGIEICVDGCSAFFAGVW